MSAPWVYSEGTSNCCGAKVFNGICIECKEHCEIEESVEIESPKANSSKNVSDSRP
jgi:hypothetical protein